MKRILSLKLQDLNQPLFEMWIRQDWGRQIIPYLATVKFPKLSSKACGIGHCGQYWNRWTSGLIQYANFCFLFQSALQI